MTPRLAPWVGTLARLLLGAVMLLAGALKLADPQAAVRAVAAYDLLSFGAAQVVGYALPGLEVVLGLLLLIGVATRAAAAASGVLLVVFVAAVASAWARGLAIDCGCFGGGGVVGVDDTRYLQEILRDIGLLAAAGWLIARPRTRFALH